MRVRRGIEIVCGGALLVLDGVIFYLYFLLPNSMNATCDASGCTKTVLNGLQSQSVATTITGILYLCVPPLAAARGALWVGKGSTIVRAALPWLAVPFLGILALVSPFGGWSSILLHGGTFLLALLVGLLAIAALAIADLVARGRSVPPTSDASLQV